MDNNQQEQSQEKGNEKNNNVFYCQGGQFLNKDDKQVLQDIRHKIIDLLNVKNIHFLLGAGTSSDSIPHMADFLKIIKEKVDSDDSSLSEESKELFGLALSESGGKEGNLEKLLGTLYSYKAYLDGTGKSSDDNDKLIELIESTIYRLINIDTCGEDAKKSLSLYKIFYQKLVNRNKDLARVNVFTLNNDVFNETALDKLNIHYNNGFGGGLNRIFNPALFSYTFSQKIDNNLEKYEPILNMAYLYKLHGSINWVEDKNITNSFFNIKEVPVVPNQESNDNVLIYPTPLKQNKSLGCPYSDLIREFQKKLLFSHSVLFIIGYGFGDEHINNIIYQALSTNTSLSVVIFGEHKEQVLSKIKDNRIYRIWGEDIERDQNIHYFEYIVNDLLPNLNEDRAEILLKEFSNNLSLLMEQGTNV